MSDDAQILAESDGAVAYLTLNRPDKRNALGERLIAELRAALAAAEADARTRAVVLRGAGRDFCAGADLAQLEKISRGSVLDNREDAAQFAALLLQIRRLKKPVIAAVHGRALAGGAGLASACDLVIAARSAQFAYTEVRIGFVPAMVMAVARRNLGEKRAFEVLATAKTLTAEEAERIGLINRVCDDADFPAAVAGLAAEVAGLSQSAIMLTKYLLYQIDAMDFEQALSAGVDLNAIARLTPDCQEGVKKFLKKG
ncbi:MAG TPA: enoyl-CoA hydratase-related protein [Blastocatellia bacterium]|nr:enoyl-CoA hydratase-related protein [Blastocatellia bacterium]